MLKLCWLMWLAVTWQLFFFYYSFEEGLITHLYSWIMCLTDRQMLIHILNMSTLPCHRNLFFLFPRSGFVYFILLLLSPCLPLSFNPSLHLKLPPLSLSSSLSLSLSLFLSLSLSTLSVTDQGTSSSLVWLTLQLVTLRSLYQPVLFASASRNLNRNQNRPNTSWLE